MSFLGKWKVKMMEVYDNEMNRIPMTPQEYIDRPMESWIDADNEDEVAHELEQRRFMVNTIIEISDDGYMYSLTPLPEGISQAEIDEAVASGEVILKDGMMLLERYEWRMLDGELLYNSGVEGEICGEEIDPYVKALNEDGDLYIEGAGAIFEKM